MMYNKLHFANAMLPAGRKLSFHRKTYGELYSKKDENDAGQVEQADTGEENQNF